MSKPRSRTVRMGETGKLVLNVRGGAVFAGHWHKTSFGWENDIDLIIFSAELRNLGIACFEMCGIDKDKISAFLKREGV